VGEATEGNWQKTLQALDQSHQDFAATLASLGEEKLDEILGQERDKELGTGLSHYVTIHGVIQHNLYHAGQIVLLKKFN
ncbi:MAG: DinB family protein, partial [Blastocatellia bacterium]|nr:DinB family protein [Blastocatellia bacterium]